MRWPKSGLDGRGLPAARTSFSKPRPVRRSGQSITYRLITLGASLRPKMTSAARGIRTRQGQLLTTESDTRISYPICTKVEADGGLAKLRGFHALTIVVSVIRIA